MFRKSKFAITNSIAKTNPMSINVKRGLVAAKRDVLLTTSGAAMEVALMKGLSATVNTTAKIIQTKTIA